MDVVVDSLRVLVAEANPAYMEAVRHLLASTARVVLAAEASAGHEVVGEVLRAQPDVALLDVHLPGCSGLAVARELRRRAPGVKIVLLLSDDGPGYRVAASEMGARWAAKDRLVEELSELLQAAEQAGDGWAVPEGGVSVDRVNLDTRFGGPRASHTGVLMRDWAQGLLQTARPALAIFLIGVVLLGLTAFLAWDLHTPVARDSAAGSRVVDELGMFGERGAIVKLNREQTEAYIAAQLARHRSDLLLCIGIGMLGLAVGSALIAWHEARERSWQPASFRQLERS